MRSWSDPVLLRLGSFELRWYGLILAAAIYASTAALAQLLRHRGHRDPWDEAAGLAAWLIPAGLLGARLGFVVQNLSYFASYPAQILATWTGGLSIHGALLGGLAALALRERSRTGFLARADLLLTVLPLGQAIGRWGNLFNREVLGYPTHLPWGLYVEPAFRPAAFRASATFHPVFLYESLADLALFAWLWWRASGSGERSDRTPRPGSTAPPLLAPPPGAQAALYLAGYAVIRFGLEFVRIGTPVLLGLTLAQWVSGGLLAGLAAWRVTARSPARRG
ncbi:prolipoprotein diacylglyceryl transferase [Limnochorda pilosa]|uniref:Phosphatidylglycerol--prolipoprotein diacylglyceryl transferase n=1 Tax=Limnochorda pilosa TaxID=1555112 RepID=A0A0K2SJH1_LIMPI|nr:prolipoprotein diacylglyceryl transferase [Limnochorda pilosa]BAS27258.1 prolipoprotein diacylglyceryl transferase [Limnochorda pilosa]